MSSLLKSAQAADELIDAVHAAFGAPGDYGYGTRQGRVLFELYRFQTELRATIRQALIDDVRAMNAAERT